MTDCIIARRGSRKTVTYYVWNRYNRNTVTTYRWNRYNVNSTTTYYWDRYNVVESTVYNWNRYSTTRYYEIVPVSGNISNSGYYPTNTTETITLYETYEATSTDGIKMHNAVHPRVTSLITPYPPQGTGKYGGYYRYYGQRVSGVLYNVVGQFMGVCGLNHNGENVLDDFTKSVCGYDTTKYPEYTKDQYLTNVNSTDSSAYPNDGRSGIYWYVYTGTTTEYTQGSTSYGQVNSTSFSAYPNNGISGNYWYVYNRQETLYTQGSSNGSVSSTNRSQYPDNGKSGSYWYVYSTSNISYSQGSYIDQVTSTSRNSFPDNNYSGNYWYVYQGTAEEVVTNQASLNSILSE